MLVSSKALYLPKARPRFFQPTSASRVLLLALAGILGMTTILTISIIALSQTLPGSGQIAAPFASNEGEDPAIYLMDVDHGIRYRTPIDKNVSNRSLAWSPDGTQLAFMSGSDGDNEISILDVTRARVRALPNDYRIRRDASLAWSPDGEQLIFVSNLQSNNEIYIMDVDSGAIRNLTSNPASDVLPSWSPDGSEVAFISDRDRSAGLYIVDTDGEHIRLLTEDRALVRTIRLAWSPDGTQLAFVSFRSGGGDIYTINADGTHLQRMTDRNGLDYSPAWSPDGSRIVYVSQESAQMVSFISIDANEGKVTRLTTQPLYCDYNHVVFSWSNDGHRIVFGLEAQEDSGVYLMNADGSDINRLFHIDFQNPFPVWRPL